MKIFNQTKTYLALTLALGLGMASCSKVNPLDVDNEAQAELLKRDKKKWAEEAEIKEKNRQDSIRMAEENKRLREVYLADLRAYKKSKHPIMFGWFASWNPTSPDKTFSLDHLPDSVDLVSNWGQQWNLSSEMKAELARLQERGTRMTIGFIIEHIGEGLRNAPEGGWSSDPYQAAEQYARALADSIEKYNYDGMDIDYEPSFSSPWKAGKHCGDPQNWTVGMPNWAETKPLIACTQTGNKEYENHFFTKLREYMPEHKLLNINGSIHYLDTRVLDKFNYFVWQSYNGTGNNWTATTTSIIARKPTLRRDQFIFTESFQTRPDNANAFSRYLPLVTDFGAGGIGAFHINEDYLYSKYENIKKAIKTLNPPMDR